MRHPRDGLQSIKAPESYRRCGQFIGSFKSKTTSASVVAELYAWIRKTKPDSGHKELWNILYEEFRNMGMDEEVVRLLEMDIRLVARFGPVDVSLLGLVRRHVSREPLVLTIDSALQGECMKAGYRVRHLEEVVQGWSA
jgi:hypothetical protein